MNKVYKNHERIYLVELTDGNLFFSLKNNIKQIINKYEVEEVKNINKYLCYDSTIFFTRLKKNYKEIEIDNNLFILPEKKLIEFKRFIDKLIIEIYNKILFNTCHYCEYSTYRNETFKYHVDSKLHNIMIKNSDINKSNEDLNTNIKNVDINNTLLNSSQNSLQNSSHNVIKTTNITNININPVPFGNEDIYNIPHKDMINILTKCYNSIIEMIKYLHCNVDKPENHNVYVSNIRREETKTFNGKMWNTNKANLVIDKLVSNIVKYIEIIFEKCKELKENNELDDPQNKFNDAFIKKYEDILFEKFDEVLIAKKSYTEILYILYDVKELINNNLILKD